MPAVLLASSVGLVLLVAVLFGSNVITVQPEDKNSNSQPVLAEQGQVASEAPAGSEPSAPVPSIAVDRQPPEYPMEIASANWLVGAWRPVYANVPVGGFCDTDVIVRFFVGGRYADGESEGRFQLHDGKITYKARQSVPEPAEDESATFQPQSLPLVTNQISRLENGNFSEDGEQWQRCEYSE